MFLDLPTERKCTGTVRNFLLKALTVAKHAITDIRSYEPVKIQLTIENVQYVNEFPFIEALRVKNACKFFNLFIYI
jgi:hypothetical protein